MEDKKEWFGEWFDSPYYHILYRNRDHREAKRFIDALCDFFHFGADQKIMDLACGKGRHAIYLNQKGLDVTGIDLSEANISYANQFANDRLRFVRHDMRQVFAKEQFDCILNMFTSFGYFDTEAENQQAIKAMAYNLKYGGKLVLDFLNPYTVINRLVKDEEKEIDGIVFKITRSLNNDDYIVKNITFTDRERQFNFQERVKAIRRIEFLDYFRQAGLRVVETFGNYQLESYVADESERMIFICEK